MRLTARGYHRVLRVARTSPTSTARKKSAGCIWPKRCRIARWPRMCAARRDAAKEILPFAEHRLPRVNTAVTSFLYPLPTISPLSRAYGERVACHVAFEDPGLGCSAGVAALFARGEFLAGPRPCIEIAGTSVQIAALSWQAHRHVSFTNDPARATVRVQISDSAEAADFTVIDDIDTRRSRRLREQSPPQLVAISRSPSASDPVIYLSRDGPADYRIFVSSKSFSAARCRSPDRRRPRRAPPRRGGLALSF